MAEREQLDLNDLLRDAGGDTDNIADLLHFTFDGQDTTVEVVPQGAGAEQTLVLHGVNLTALGSDSDIISHLLAGGNSHHGS